MGNNMCNLNRTRILLFSPAFFGYENKIKNKMENLGAIVDIFDERSINKNWQKAILKINPNIFNSLTERYYFNILNKIKHNKYDYILFIKCDMPTVKVLSVYKETFTKAKMCLHMWDSIKNIPNIKEKFVYFDYISSFDRNDCKNNTFIHFRPLFYCDEYKKQDKRGLFKYDLCFIGTIHSDRYKILKIIKKNAEQAGLKIFVYPYLQSKFIYYFYKLTKREFKNTKITDFKFEKLSASEIAEIVDESNVIIDIQHPNQTGLTIRTIEMIGMNKKIMTTNQDVINYDFYNRNNITMLYRNQNKFNLNNLYEKYQEIDSKIYKSYSLENWIYDVLGK